MSVDLISEYHIEPGAEFGMAEYSMILGQPYVDFAVINILGGYSILIDATKIVWPEKWRSEEINRLERRALDSSLSYIRFSSNYEELEK